MARIEVFGDIGLAQRLRQGRDQRGRSRASEAGKKPAHRSPEVGRDARRWRTDIRNGTAASPVTKPTAAKRQLAPTPYYASPEAFEAANQAAWRVYQLAVAQDSQVVGHKPHGRAATHQTPAPWESLKSPATRNGSTSH